LSKRCEDGDFIMWSLLGELKNPDATHFPNSLERNFDEGQQKRISKLGQSPKGIAGKRVVSYNIFHELGNGKNKKRGGQAKNERVMNEEICRLEQFVPSKSLTENLTPALFYQYHNFFRERVYFLNSIFYRER